MTEEERVDEAIKILVEKGVWKVNAYPLLHRILRRFGVVVRPSVYSSKLALGAGFGLYFALVWGVGMYLFGYGGNLLALGLGAALAGTLFGASMAGYLHWQKKRLDLPEWHEIGADK